MQVLQSKPLIAWRTMSWNNHSSVRVWSHMEACALEKEAAKECFGLTLKAPHTHYDFKSTDKSSGWWIKLLQ